MRSTLLAGLVLSVAFLGGCEKKSSSEPATPPSAAGTEKTMGESMDSAAGAAKDAAEKTKAAAEKAQGDLEGAMEGDDH